MFNPKNLLTLLPPAQPPLRLALRLTPEPLLSPLIAALVTHLMRGQPIQERLAELSGKRVSLLITDPACELRFRITGRGLASDWDKRAGRGWDVRIRGSFDDFWLMATRTEDPDTLFFSRRLEIEGDTETGLALKNLLDALEYDWHAHVAAVAGPLAALLPARRHR
ncbi:MAG TPA: SCP2 sterol-binding domain-containing protein [Acidiferrobacterales bacterium]|nr:SCP2 sterol-binding domain-containing protein [Acidiferrobacterales bacterium]